MENFTEQSNNDEKVLFADESTPGPSAKDNQKNQFKLLIVDDEKEVHNLTRLVLSDYNYKGWTLKFLSAYSGKEAKRLIRDNPDAACMLLDVVMETKTAGLDIAKFVREEEKNEKLRIILRTGQPGKAPEKDIIFNYDINDYKEKTELTTQKLFTTITTALRSYLHLVELDKKTREIVQKNIQLNEEIARRIVAESNLTKYNRSLEKMIESKSSRLKTAIKCLEEKEKLIREANKLTGVGDISSTVFSQTKFSGQSIKDDLDTINTYRSDMTCLLEKYEILKDIIAAPSDAVSRTSIRTALSDIDLFCRQIDLDKLLADYPEIIKDAVNGIEHISKAVADIRLFISINDEPAIPTDINSILKRAIDDLNPRFSSNIDLQTDFEPLPKINIAAENIRKAFHEIIKNAFQAVKSRGIISVATAFQDPDIIIQISDVGQGIAPENLVHVFKPYFTTDKNARGLGLSFARSVILSNNGTIDVSSTQNEGSNITVILSTDDLSQPRV